MDVVVVANQKGGAGKTTLCRNLAVAAGPDVALIDRDPQGSLTSWWNRRAAETPVLAQVRGTLAATLEALQDAGIRTVFVDTPPAANAEMVAILQLASFILIPVRPTPDDLDAVGPTLRLIEQSGRPFGFVLSQAKSATRLAVEAVPVLAESGSLCPTVVYDRIAYPTAALTGQAVTEFPPSAASAEIEQVLQYVMTQIRKAAT